MSSDIAPSFLQSVFQPASVRSSIDSNAARREAGASIRELARMPPLGAGAGDAQATRQVAVMPSLSIFA